MRLKHKDWFAYITKLAALHTKAGELVKGYITANIKDLSSITKTERDALIKYTNQVVSKYGEAAGALAAEMYDALALAQGANIPAADPAPTPLYSEVAKTINGVLKMSKNPNKIGDASGRLVKRTGADTVLRNAQRDGAEFAWVPSGDTCAFCRTLASRGWQKMSKNALKNGHAEHIHSKCNCTYTIRFSEDFEIEGYDPQQYLDEYNAAEGETSKDKINAMRRMQYEKNKDVINEKKRYAYNKRKEVSLKHIAMTIESRHSVGKPPGIALFNDLLSKKQEKLLEQLQKYDDMIEVSKRDVSMKDLAALSAHENVEFAMFTKRGRRLIIRGGRNDVNINEEKMMELVRQGYRWSGHTHPTNNILELAPSKGDRDVLKASGQRHSVIYNSTGRKYVFGIEEKDDIGHKE